jgi:L-ascorbate metabolism protein UlaG (beta-lactamase superfamily)
MNNEKLYLKPNVVFEPLVNLWYAWSHLISPATAAMNVVGRHIKIMESYLQAPDIHAHAVLNPKMKGGPFMDFKGEKSKEITGLIEETYKSQANLIDFAKAIVELDELLRTEAKGYGLEDIYQRIPELLKGYVEIYYDRQNNPGFRFFEPLLYKSKYFDRESQSFSLWLTENDERAFCLSTPRLPEKEVLNLQIPFDDVGMDALARMKRIPQDIESIKNRLKIRPEDEALFNTFFTSEAPPAYKPYLGNKIRMRYFGHACILIETKDVTILVDPLISYYGYDSSLVHFSDMDLPEKIDYVLITHNHQDHILLETLIPLRHKIKAIVVPRTCSGKLEDPSLELMFRSIGFNNVISLTELESIVTRDVSITSLPFTGEHSDLNILTKSCFLVQIGDFKLLFLADSRIVESALYKHVHKLTGDVDVMFLGMECDGAPLTWLYGPLMTKKLSRDQDSSRRLAGSDFNKGKSLVDIFDPKEVYVYAMGQEPWLEFISSIKYTDDSNPIIQSNKLIEYCLNKNIIAERLYGEKELLYSKYRDIDNCNAEEPLYNGAQK